MGIDAGVVILPVNSRNVIERVVVNDSKTEKTLIENIRRADRLPVTAERRIWLSPVESTGLCRIWRSRRIRRDQVRVTRHSVIIGLAAEGIRMNRDVAAATIEQHSAIDTIVH